jgi:nicotinate-nucleotide pyrophosphorylase (carboxylating)
MNKPGLPLISFHQHFNKAQFIKDSFIEDEGDGDHTSLACIPASAKGKARLIVKEKGILAGMAIALDIFKAADKNLKIESFLKDGSLVNPGDIALQVDGKARSILKAERLVLNVMQRMSGIATLTSEMMKECKGTKAKVIDTRKTTPGFRALEKAAVLIGGGANHRYGLFDMILIKDNHVDYAGGIRNAILAANNYLKNTGKKLKIEIETRNLDEVKQALSVGKIDRIMLDNFSPAEMKKAIKLINSRYETEASGGITLKNIGTYAKTGVDFISVGALTHSVKSLDLSLKAFK